MGYESKVNKCVRSYQKDGMDLQAKVGLDVKADDATYAPQWCEKFYYSHNEAFWGEQSRRSSIDKNGLRVRKEDWFCFYGS